MKKVDREFLRGLFSQVWNEKMTDYCTAKADVIVRMDSGDVFVIDKPRITKTFCFGYSDSPYDTEDYDRAARAAEHAYKSIDYFIQQNMEDSDFCRWIEILDDYIKDPRCAHVQVYKTAAYCSQPSD